MSVELPNENKYNELPNVLGQYLYHIENYRLIIYYINKIDEYINALQGQKISCFTHKGKTYAPKFRCEEVIKLRKTGAKIMIPDFQYQYINRPKFIKHMVTMLTFEKNRLLKSKSEYDNGVYESDYMHYDMRYDTDDNRYRFTFMEIGLTADMNADLFGDIFDFINVKKNDIR